MKLEGLIGHPALFCILLIASNLSSLTTRILKYKVLITTQSVTYFVNKTPKEKLPTVISYTIEKSDGRIEPLVRVTWPRTWCMCH